MQQYVYICDTMRCLLCCVLCWYGCNLEAPPPLIGNGGVIVVIASFGVISLLVKGCLEIRNTPW